MCDMRPGLQCESVTRKVLFLLPSGTRQSLLLDVSNLMHQKSQSVSQWFLVTGRRGLRAHETVHTLTRWRSVCRALWWFLVGQKGAGNLLTERHYCSLGHYAMLPLEFGWYRLCFTFKIYILMIVEIWPVLLFQVPPPPLSKLEAQILPNLVYIHVWVNDFLQLWAKQNQLLKIAPGWGGRSGISIIPGRRVVIVSIRKAALEPNI